MTLRTKLELAGAIVLALAVGWAMLATRGCRAADQAAQASTERAAMPGQGVTPLAPVTSAPVPSSLVPAVSKAQAKIPSHVAESWTASTGPVTILPGDGVVCPVASPPLLSPAGGAAVAGAPPVTCRLAAGDTAEIRLQGVELVTLAGARGILGRAQLVRLAPPPEATLIDAPVSAAVSQGWTLDGAVTTPHRSRWAITASGGLSTDGYAAEGGIERRLWGSGWLRASAGIVGHAGFVMAGVRWEF